MAGWSRLCAYATQDGGKVFFQGLSPKFWKRFCAAIGRNDLLSPQHDDRAEQDDSLHAELTAIFASRPRPAWMQLCIEHDVPGGPANTRRAQARAPHILARDNLAQAWKPASGHLRPTGTTVKKIEPAFGPAPGPPREKA